MLLRILERDVVLGQPRLPLPVLQQDEPDLHRHAKEKKEVLFRSDRKTTVGIPRALESIGRELPCRDQVGNPARFWVDSATSLRWGEKQEPLRFPLALRRRRSDEGSRG